VSRNSSRATAVSVALALTCLGALTSCALVPLLPKPVHTRESTAGPDGWENFPGCPGGPKDQYVWVEGFPYQELEEAGMRPACGDTWIEDDGEHFIDVLVPDMTEAQLEEFGEALVASGYEKKWDDFVPAVSSSEPKAGVGARDFYLPDLETRVAIEIYHNGTDPITYTAYIDYLSPLTRELN
jgi:hypothetical protein